LFVLLMVLASGCVAIRPHDATVPPSCAADPGLIGSWTDARMTQLGPAWVRLSLRADCTSTLRAQLLWMRVIRAARFESANGPRAMTVRAWLTG
jgi:hypothetical protein